MDLKGDNLMIRFTIINIHKLLLIIIYSSGFLFALKCQVVSGSRAHIAAGEGRTDQAGRSRADRAEGRQEGGRQDGDQDQRARVGAGFREQKVLLDSQCQLKAQY